MGNPIRVVLADDDPAFLESLAVALESDGRFEVIGMAGDGGEAFQLGCWQEPDVLVMDAEMPHIDGWEAARLLQQSKARTCVLMVSGADPEVFAHRAKSVGISAFLSKTKFDEIPDAVAALAAALAGGSD
jgi:DNA-binding NarL/FixJ family response regulator